MKKTVMALLTSALLVSAHQDAHIIDQGNKAAKTLMQTLSSNLKKTLKEKGLIEAARFCNANAATLTQEVDAQLGENISVQRLTLKPRNPSNEATGAHVDVLRAYEALHKMGKELPAYTLVDNGTKHVTMYKPMVLNKEACLKCHGDIDKKSEIGAFLSSHYPNDKATGYKMGDFRGALAITITK